MKTTTNPKLQKSLSALTALALSLTAGISSAQIKNMKQMNMQLNADGRAALAREMSKVTTTEDGSTIRYAPYSTIEKVLKQVGDKASLQLGDKTIKIIPETSEKSGGGVIVGSGAGDLISTSSADATGPVVVTPPVTPKTSITIVGRLSPAQKDLMFCVNQFAVDELGQLKRAGGEVTPMNDCAAINQPLRLKAGFYWVHLGQRGYTFNISTLLKLEAGENIVIPLREIHVAKIAGESKTKVNYGVFPDLTSTIEQDKFLTAAFSLCSLDGICNYTIAATMRERDIFKNATSPSDLRSIFSSRPADFMRISRAISWNCAPQQADDFTVVLPGVYQVNWEIIDENGQKQEEDPTRGVVVE